MLVRGIIAFLLIFAAIWGFSWWVKHTSTGALKETATTLLEVFLGAVVAGGLIVTFVYLF